MCGGVWWGLAKEWCGLFGLDYLFGFLVFFFLFFVVECF
jgi:hypothetical protein